MNSDKKPNILLILNDDMGYSDLGCYGGEIQTKTLNMLAENGLKYTNFYNTARCCPSRASLLTGLNPHQAGIGHMVNNLGPEQYSGRLNKRCVTIAEVLKERGYGTYLSGKWHMTRKSDIKKGKKVAWPIQRGFDHCYCFLAGAASYFWPAAMIRDNEFIDDEIRNDPDYYITDAISDNAVKYIEDHTDKKPDVPFFMYVAYTAPHWPLHAKPEDIEKYKGRFSKGWDTLREERLTRMKQMGLLNDNMPLTDRDPTVPAWDEVENKEWQQKRMEVYAAQIDCMDQGIGRIVDKLKETNQFENTLIIFLADNGGCHEVMKAQKGSGKVRGLSAQATTKNGEKIVRFGNTPEIIPGPEDTYVSYGREWANLSNTPFRMYKHWTHEGGLATPFIVHWPNGIAAKGELRDNLAQLMDVMATFVDVAGAEYPKEYKGNSIHPMEGDSLIPTFENKDNGKEWLYWEHQGNQAIRYKNWKLVRDYPAPWELYDLDKDPIEMDNLIKKEPEQAKLMQEMYEKWANRIGVKDRIELLIKGVPKFLKPFARKQYKKRDCHVEWQDVIKNRMV